MEYVAEESFLLVEKMQKCANVYKATSTHLCLNLLNVASTKSTHPWRFI
ncbi:MAG: hypothetical protein IK102_06670 [Treponema sp.]|nr:hypothetical protein [Treponema sp.]